MKFQGKIALVSGASRGLGHAVAQTMAKEGAHVIALARTPGALEELDDVIQANGGQATLVPMDITDENAVQHLCRSVYERWGGLDYWVHCAIHATPLTPTPHIDPKDLEKSISTNITATARLIRNIEPLLKQKSGTAVHIKDTHMSEKFFGTYATAKAAQSALFDTWKAEAASSDMAVTAFSPKPMPTATRARFHPGEDRSNLSSCESQAAELITLL